VNALVYIFSLLMTVGLSLWIVHCEHVHRGDKYTRIMSYLRKKHNDDDDE